MGDFNINILNSDNHLMTDSFVNNLATYFFQPHILHPTRITSHSATLIDNIFFNSLDHNTVSGNILSDVSDHLPNFLLINQIDTVKKDQTIYKRDYSSLNEKEFLGKFEQLDWGEVFQGINDVNQAFGTFYSTATNIIDQHIPLRKLSKRESKLRRKPWITPALAISIGMKNKLFRKYVKTKNQHHHIRYKLYRNKLNHLIKLSKRSYYLDYFSANKNNIKNMWKGIKQLISLKPEASKVPSKIIKSNEVITDPIRIANEFNNFFANIGHSLSNSIPKVNKSFEDYMPHPQVSSFFMNPTTAHEIENLILDLKPGKACGPYSIPIPILKLLKSTLSKPLATLFNHSFKSGTVPDSLKVARIIPVHKGGSPLTQTNYRPISLLSIFHKLMEKLVHRRITNYLTKLTIIYDGQFGFRSNHSTTHALLLITDKIQRAIDEGTYSCGIFLDLSKAFDTVNHKILLRKLEIYGIRGIALEWFTSYLSNRKQFVSIGNNTSDLKQVLCGVPQGSVLGPLLFLLYINDFHHCSKLLEFHLFADDCNLFLADKELCTLETKLNQELTNIHTWLCANKLSLNTDKTHFVIFHSPQRKLHKNVVLKIMNKIITQKYDVKYLGVMFDSNLKWTKHIHEVSKKVSRGIGILCRLRHHIPRNISIQLYYSLIYPFLTYGLVIWGNTYDTALKPISVLQKKTMRIMTFSRYDEHSSPLFRALKILKIADVIHLQNSMLLYNYHSKILPSVFDNFFQTVASVHHYNTRLAAKSSYYIPYAKTNYGKFNIRYRGAKIWNALDEKTKSLPRTSFKNKIVIDFLNSY